jgi:toluene monooxygenase system protein B
MALFPLTSNFEGDFVLQLVAVDTDNTMDEVAAAAAVHSVGRRVRARPGHILRVRRQGGRLLCAREVADSGSSPRRRWRSSGRRRRRKAFQRCWA